VKAVLKPVTLFPSAKPWADFCNLKTFYLGQNWKVISPREFYDKQRITRKMLQEINEWFDRK